MQIIPVFNMKGGVGKTAVSVALAESFAYFCGLRVLIVDADPQRSASARLCPPDIVDSYDKAGNEKNIGKYLRDSVVRPHSLPNPTKYIVQRVGTIHGKGAVDILMGSVDTSNVDRDFAARSVVPQTSVFENLVAAFRNLNTGDINYDIVIVDCQTGLNTIVQGGLSASDLIIFPMTLQKSSSSPWQYWSVQKHIKNQFRATGFPVPGQLPLANRYKASQTTFLGRIAEWLGAELRLKINEQSKMADAELFSRSAGTTPSQKYGSIVEKQLKALVEEVSKRLGLSKKRVTKRRDGSTKEVGDVGKAGSNRRSLFNGIGRHNQ